MRAALSVCLSLLGACSSLDAEPLADAPPIAAPVVGPQGDDPTIAPTPEAPPASRVVRLSFAGDLVLNPHASDAVMDDGPNGYANLLAGYARVIDEAEITIVNVEQPLVNDVIPLDAGWPRQDTSRPRRSPILGATPPLANALREAGVDVATLANNHAYDQERSGLERTVDALHAQHIDTVGAGPDADTSYGGILVERDGVRVGILSFSDFFNQPPAGDGPYAAAWLSESERVEAAIRAMRARADVVVVAVHWSRDFLTDVRASERALADRLIELGADVIAGTGPHVLQEVERRESPRGDAVVAYSLGNLVSGMGRSYRIGHPPQHFIHPANVTPEARDGAVLHVAVELDPDGRIHLALEATPLWTENNWNEHQRDGVPHRVRVVPLAETAANVQTERGARIAAALGAAVTLRGRANDPPIVDEPFEPPRAP